MLPLHRVVLLDSLLDVPATLLAGEDNALGLQLVEILLELACLVDVLAEAVALVCKPWREVELEVQGRQRLVHPFQVAGLLGHLEEVAGASFSSGFDHNPLANMDSVECAAFNLFSSVWKFSTQLTVFGYVEALESSRSKRDTNSNA
jgi:hypothetical protein